MLQTYRQNGSSVRDAGAKTNGNARGDVRRGELGHLAHARAPHDETPNNADDELSACHEPVSVDHVGRLLVVHIVEGVSGVPGRDQADLFTMMASGDW